MKTFLVCALEASANLHLNFVLEKYQQKYGEFELVGIFDSAFCDKFKLKNKPLFDSSEFSAMGFVEVLPLIFKAKRAIKSLVNLALNNEISAILCIDSPAFNIPFAKALKKANSKIKRIYYILPQVWAWKKGRIPVIERHFDILCSIWPFEKDFFKTAKYIGHPLLDELNECKNANFIKTNKIAFLPGSRKSEIKRLMPVFRDLAKSFNEEKILCVPKFNLDKINEIYGDTSDFIIKSDTPKVLLESDFAFVCSGTATLEAALINTPFVLVYKAKKIDIFIAKIFVKLKHIGLANIIFDFNHKEALHAEFLQDEVSVENLKNAYENFNYKEFFDKVSFLKTYLKHGSAENLAQILNEN